MIASRLAEYKEAFALFDKKGTGAVQREVLGDLLRALGQNPTQAEVAEIIAGAPREGTCTRSGTGALQLTRLLPLFSMVRTTAPCVTTMGPSVDYKTFLTILNRQDGFKPAGTPGSFVLFSLDGL